MTEFQFPRRATLERMTPAELAIREAILAVEAAGCHPLLTDAVALLMQAQSTVADFVDLPAAAQERPSGAQEGGQ